MIRKKLMYLLILLLIGYGLWLAVGFAIQRRVLFARHFTGPPTDGDGGGEIHFLQSNSAKVEWWFLPGLGVSDPRPGPLVLFAHGNAELISDCAVLSQFYNQAGISVALIEYRGYGRSTGSPTEAAITEDYIAVYDQLVRRPDVDPARIIFHGRSLGGGVVCALARARKPAAIILQSAFTSVDALAGRYLIPPPLVRDHFDNLAALKTYLGPVLICHGRADRIVPFSHARRLQRAAPHATAYAFDCGHNDFPVASADYQRLLRKFLHDHHLLPAH